MNMEQKTHDVWKGLFISYIGNLGEKSWEELLALLLTSFALAKGPQACSPKANGTINDLKGERKQ